MSAIIRHMHDESRSRPNHQCLFHIASAQMGYFTNPQAAACGFSRDALSMHSQSGRFVRERRGLYRLRDFPSSPREHVMAAWLAVGRDVAVVSHESALDLHELSDVIPDAVHLTVPRLKRAHPKLPGVKIHTTSRAFGPNEIVRLDGMRVTAPIRTILDVDDTGLSLEHVEVAALQAIQRGQATREMFEGQAAARGGRFRADLAHGRIHL